VDTESLARATGLPLARVQRLAAQGRLHTLYDEYGQPVRQQANRSSMTPRQRQLATLEMRWPKQPLTPRQKICELHRMRGEWYLTPKQAELQRMRAGWV
jgi:hypothetical protein